jgi:hypothetical protein
MLTAHNTRSVEGKHWVFQELMENASLDVNVLKIILEGCVHLYTRTGNVQIIGAPKIFFDKIYNFFSTSYAL